MTDSTSGVIIRRSLLKVDERESGELFEELLWNDVACFFPMNINILLLGFFLKGVEMETTFSLFKNCLAEIKSSFVLNIAFPGRRKQCWRRISRVSLEAEAVSIEQIAVLVFFGEKKCNFKSVSRFAVIEFERYWCDVFLVEYGWLIKISWKISSFCYRRVWWRNSSCLRQKSLRRCWRHRNRKCWQFICASRRFYKLLHWQNHSGAFQ